MSTFYTLPALKSLVVGRRSDLAALRKMSSDITAQNKRLEDVRFSKDFVTAEQGKTREVALVKATKYLEDHATFRYCDEIKQQSEFWSVSQFLARAAGAPNDQLGVLKALYLVTSLPRLTVATIKERADAAVQTKDWQALGACFNELTWRAKANDGDAQSMQTQLQQTMEIPDIAEAEHLIQEGAQLREFLLYTLRSISTGANDLGISMEAIARAGEADDTIAAKAIVQEELDRQAGVVQWQRAS